MWEKETSIFSFFHNVFKSLLLQSRDFVGKGLNVAVIVKMIFDVYFILAWISNYSITCIQRPPKGSNESGLLQQVVFKCRYYLLDLRRGCC